jgi:hypothetical protein
MTDEEKIVGSPTLRELEEEARLKKNAYHREYRKRNRERLLAIERKYRTNPENKGPLLASSLRCRREQRARQKQEKTEAVREEFDGMWD